MLREIAYNALREKIALAFEIQLQIFLEDEPLKSITDNIFEGAEEKLLQSDPEDYAVVVTQGLIPGSFHVTLESSELFKLRKQLVKNNSSDMTQELATLALNDYMKRHPKANLSALETIFYVDKKTISIKAKVRQCRKKKTT